MMAMQTKVRAFSAAVMGAAIVLLGAGVAAAHPSPQQPVVSGPIVDGLVGPLQFEVPGEHGVLVGQSFSGTVSMVSEKGGVTDLFQDPGVDGVAAGKSGSTIYTHTGETGGAEVRIHTRSGSTSTLADLGAYEAANNPDGHQQYGLLGLTPECAAQLPPDEGILPYNGIVDSHPYALSRVRSGVYVADAAGNDILFVDWHGHVRTVALLPPQPPVLVTDAAAAANQLPPCVAGSHFVAEPVPTDVEIGPDGQLYVSTLPGGPEDPSLGSRGSVYRVSPRSGRVKLVATGFAGATNLAVSPSGTIYVSELFGNQVSKVVGNHGVPVVSLSMPTGLEWAHGRLYVAIDSLESGKLVTISHLGDRCEGRRSRCSHDDHADA